jgi:hypothetical protein
MRRSAVAVIAVAGSLVLAACSERDSTSSRGLITAPTSSALTIIPATTCDIEAMESAAHAYFSSRSDVVFQTIELMEADRNAHKTAAMNADGFVMLREVAAKRLTSGVVATATSAGASFVIDVLRCTTLTFPPAASPDVKQTFLGNLALILDAGIFDVRGGFGDGTGPAAALLSVGGVRTLAAPHWGVEPHPTWPTDGHFLVYGYPTLTSDAVIDPATNLNTNGPNTYNSFEIGTIPDSHLKTGLLVGICYSSVIGTTAANRLIHNNADLFDNAAPSALCSITTASLDAVKWYARALHDAASLFVPKSASAMQGGEVDIGGLPSSWSPFSTALIVGSNVVDTITTQPPATPSVNKAFPVIVRAITNGVPVPGVSVTLTIVNNNGVPAGAIIVGNATVTTNSQGNAIFSIAVGKPGGYNLVAGGTMSGVVATNGVMSVRFNVKNH